MIFILKTHSKGLVWKDYGVSLLSNWAEEDFVFDFAEILRRVSCEPLANLFMVSGSGLRNLSFNSKLKIEERQAEDVA